MVNRPLFLAILFVSSLSGCVRFSKAAVESRIRNVERGLMADQGDPPWEKMALTERMAFYNVPGVSITVINDYEIEWAKGYGVLAAGSNEPVTTESLFQSASLAKPIVAALHYVEQGLIELDGDVNHALNSWRLPENELTAVEKVTLRRLLSHSAGVTVSGFRGYTQGESIPTLQQILDGEPPANSAPIRVDIVPGTEHRYSGGGYMIVQQLLEDVADEPFPELMRDTVLDPWGMTNSTFTSPLPKQLQVQAASAHRANGRLIPGRWHIYPEMGSGASMWATPSDLARFAIGVMLAYNGRSDAVLSHEMATQMLTAQLGDRGLGPIVLNDGGDLFYFLHPGANDGYKNYLVAYPLRGQGAVIMTNSDGGAALYREILNSTSVEYGWLSNNTSIYVGSTVVILLVLAVILRLRAHRARKTVVIAEKYNEK